MPPERAEGAGFVLRSLLPGDGPALREASLSSYEHLRPWTPWASLEQTEAEAERHARTRRGRWLLAEDCAIGIFGSDQRTLLGGCGFHLREGGLAPR